MNAFALAQSSREIAAIARERHAIDDVWQRAEFREQCPATGIEDHHIVGQVTCPAADGGEYTVG